MHVHLLEGGVPWVIGLRRALPAPKTNGGPTYLWLNERPGLLLLSGRQPESEPWR